MTGRIQAIHSLGTIHYTEEVVGFDMLYKNLFIYP